MSKHLSPLHASLRILLVYVLSLAACVVWTAAELPL
jgi:hypothetical protein